MAKILYTASTAEGERTEGFIEAMSAASARALLRHQGLTEIVLHEEPAIPTDETQLIGLSTAEQRALARFKLRVMRSPGLSTALAETARQLGWASLLLCLVLVGFGVYRDEWAWIVGGLLVVALPFALTAWRWRHVGRYQKFLRLLAVGQWDAARAVAAQLRGVARKTPLMDFDLDVRLAGVDARRGNLAGVLEPLVAKWQMAMLPHAGLFECRVASVHLSAGDFAGFVRLQAEAAEKSGGDPSRTLDHALAEARLGDPQLASALLAALDASLLPPHAAGFLKWTRGFVQLRQRSADAATTLGEAVIDLLKLAEQPGAWQSLAMCTCDHAVALNLAGQRDAARRQIAAVWPVLKANAPESLLRMLDDDGLLPLQSSKTHSTH